MLFEEERFVGYESLIVPRQLFVGAVAVWGTEVRG